MLIKINSWFLFFRANNAKVCLYNKEELQSVFKYLNTDDIELGSFGNIIINYKWKNMLRKVIKSIKRLLKDIKTKGGLIQESFYWQFAQKQPILEPNLLMVTNNAYKPHIRHCFVLLF